MGGKVNKPLHEQTVYQYVNETEREVMVNEFINLRINNMISPSQLLQKESDGKYLRIYKYDIPFNPDFSMVDRNKNMKEIIRSLEKLTLEELLSIEQITKIISSEFITDKCKLLFPSLPVTHWIQINLDDEFKKRQHLNMRSPDDQQTLLNELSQNGTVKTYGGFRENRSSIWEGFEPDHKTMIHLGIDFNNLNAGEKVASVSGGTVASIINDTTEFNGWGTKIIIKDNKYFYIYGHLMDPQIKLGDLVKKGQIIGYIASSEKNGGWFPHLHLQMAEINSLNVNIENLDGYEFTQGEIKGIVDPLLHF